MKRTASSASSPRPAPASDADLQAIIQTYWTLKQPEERKAMTRFIVETFGTR